MHLTRMSEIAIDVLIACARDEGSPVRTVDVARQARATKDHTAQVAALLCRSGLLANRRGRHGGLTLAVEPASITIGDVVRLTQPDLCRNTDKTDGNRTAAGLGDEHEPAGLPSRPVDILVAAAARSFVATIDDFTLADLMVASATPADAARPDGRLACLDCDLKTNVLRRDGTMLLHSAFALPDGRHPKIRERRFRHATV